MLPIANKWYHPFGLTAAERTLTSQRDFTSRLSCWQLWSFRCVFYSEQGVVMDSTFVETVVEVQELTLAELAHVGGGFGEAVFA